MTKRIVALVCLLILLVSMAVQADAPLVSNVFDNTYLIDALRDVSGQTGVVIVADSTVTGQVTLTLDNVPLEDALQRLLACGGYVYRKLDGYYLVGAPDLKNPSFPLLSRTETVKLSYTKAENVIQALADSFAPFVRIDRDNNALVITAPENYIARIMADISTIDKPARQVMMEALVIEVSQNGRKDLGLDWMGWEVKEAGAPGGFNSDTFQIQDFGFSIAQITNGGLNKFLAALKVSVDKGDARVQANPRVATIDGQIAEIFVGKERYYYLTSGTNANGSMVSSNLEPIKSGITLRMQPQVADNGDITVKIEPEVSDVSTESDSSGNSSNGLPVISSRRVSAMVRVKDGESIVLGGLIQRASQKIKTKIPVLGDIPILSFFFSRTKNVEEENEILIIIRPKIIDDGVMIDEETKTRLGIEENP